MRFRMSWAIVVIASVCFQAQATMTENLDMRVLPAPGKVAVDGKFDDWDLSSGVFACGDVENARDKFAVWVHAMYDKDNLYVLARWIDHTPMNNPGSSKGDYGFNGDCLQVRFLTAPAADIQSLRLNPQDRNDPPTVLCSHWDSWFDRDGLDSLGRSYGTHFNAGGANAKQKGGAQAFRKHDDAKGYTQEIRLPWSVLLKPGVLLKAGDKFIMTVEPNFTIGTGGRLTIKDIFRPGSAIDRVFTFSGNGCWGYAALEPKGKLTPRPVRLADGREFQVRMENGIPIVDWTGLIRSREPEGFKSARISLPADGCVSLNIFRPDGTVARQLLASAFYTRGEHEIKWDGLTTMSVRRPGEPVAPGDYTWKAIWHTGIGLRLRGWACNSGSAPYEGPTGKENWGGDHGDPICCAADAKRVYLGWAGAEAGKPLVAVDLDGNVQWRNIRGGIASAKLVAADQNTVYAFNDVGQYAAVAIYRVDANTGRYTEWTDLRSTDLPISALLAGAGAPDGKLQNPGSLAAGGGKVYVGFGQPANAIVVVDGKSGKIIKKLTVPNPGDIEVVNENQIYAISDGRAILSVNVDTGELRTIVKPALPEKAWLSALALDKAGNIYAGVRDGDNQVLVFSPDGTQIKTIGRKGGRALLGPWTPDGMLNISGLAVDAAGKLWVAENDGSPRRFSAWNTATGAFVKEFFGASTYGAIGAAINPVDPSLMVGQGSEWRLDPETGKAACLGTIWRGGMGASRFGFGPAAADGTRRLYLAITPGFLHGQNPVYILERLGDAGYKLRTRLALDGKTVVVWSDANDDAQEQPGEIKRYDTDLGGWIQGWYLSMAPDMTFYGTLYQVKPTGWTACGAPQYDLGEAKRMAGPQNPNSRGGMGAMRGMGSADGRFMLYNASYGADHSTVDCYDIAANKLMWTYPSNFTGVHGSHRACPPEVGMIRGAYDITGTAKLPPPIGNVWVIPTNKGEWHVLTDEGFYLTRLFEGDPMKYSWPDKPAPGAIMDACPPGAGEEAFGGSITQGIDGKLYVQAGHTGFWNVEVVGLETVKPLPGGKISISEADAAQARIYREKYLQAATGTKRLQAQKATPAFTGDLDNDFAGQQIAAYQRMDAARLRTALAWDAQNLYAAWEVKDDSPWVNGADAPEFMYARGDTVDLQLATDPAADAKRQEAAMGDLRLSIGPFQGKPTAVLYRKVAKDKAPRSFNSGVVKDYVMESVTVLPAAKIEVTVDPVKRQYIVEATIPLTALGLQPAHGLTIKGDFGATHGSKAGNDTALRSFWNNQATGLVSDEVFELKMEPQNWGQIEFNEQ